MLHELRYTFRVLGRAPAFALSAVAAVALGVGANTAVFSVVHAVLLEPLPYADPHRLVRVYETNDAQGISRGDVSPATFVELRTRSRTIERAALYRHGEWLIGVGEELERLSGALVSPSLFGVLGVGPVLGRTFRPEDQQPSAAGDSHETVIGYDLWQRRFGGSADVLGRTVWIEGRVARRIVGVMPRGFDFPHGTQIWGPQTFLRAIGPGQRQARHYGAVARLAAGASDETVSNELTGISAQLAQEYPDSHGGFAIAVEPLDRATTGNIRPALLVIAGVAGCVLLIACANVAGLMVVRAAARRRELAVRAALGATALRLLRQRFIESAVLSAGGTAAGVLLAWWGTRVLVAAAPGGIPRLDRAGISGIVLAFTGLLAVFCAVVTAIVPALQVATGNAQEMLKGPGRLSPVRRQARQPILVLEIAITVVLLVGTVVLLRSFVRLRGVDLGFQPARVVTAELRFPTGRFAETRRPWVRLRDAFDRIIEDIESMPGVAAAGGVTGLPLTGEGAATQMWLGDAAEPPPDPNSRGHVPVAIVTPRYFAAMGISLVRGRTFDENDRLGESVLTDPSVPRPRGVAIVNVAFARHYWPAADPIGRAIRLEDHWAVSASTIVGVVRDVRADRVESPATPTVFLPWGEVPGFRLALAARTTGDSHVLAGVLRVRLRALDARLLVSNLRPLDAVVSEAVARPRFNLLLVASFAALALTLAALAVYSVVSYLVTRRTREIGVRMALGALRRDVVRLVLADGLRPVLAGLAAGLVTATLAVRFLRAILFEVAPADPVSFAAASAILLVIAVVAALVPARRAASVDPAVALREE